MKMKVGWSDLLIEKGTRDPLGLWRVGDRMIGDLLGPFTTVVTNRPARYFSMYCWIFSQLEKNSTITTPEEFWKRFYRLEFLLVCAIALHEDHDYEGFGGQIGVDTANSLIEKSRDDREYVTRSRVIRVSFSPMSAFYTRFLHQPSNSIQTIVTTSISEILMNIRTAVGSSTLFPIVPNLFGDFPVVDSSSRNGFL